MPLAYRGRLGEDRCRTIEQAIVKGEGYVTAFSHYHLDLRYVFAENPPEEIIKAMGEIDVRWFDLPIFPDRALLETVGQLLDERNDFGISCTGYLDGIELIFSLETDLVPLRRFDDLRSYENEPSTVRLRVELSNPKPNPSAQTLVDAIASVQTDISTVFKKYPMDSAAAGREVTPAVLRGRVQEVSFTQTDTEGFDFSTQKFDEANCRIQLRTNKSFVPEMGAVWQLLANRVHRIEAARLCVVSRSDDVTTYLRDLDIDDRSRSTSVPRFGFLTTRNREGYQYDKEGLASAHASFQKRAIEWDTRWSGWTLDTGKAINEPPLSRNRLIIQSKKGGSSDQLYIECVENETNTPSFRDHRAQAIEIFGARLAQRNAWQFMGIDTRDEEAAHIQRLNESLRKYVGNYPGLAQSVTSPVSKIGRSFWDLNPQKVKDFHTSMVQALTTAMPGFIWDEHAHSTANYFLDFVRHESSFHQYIRVERVIRPTGFRFSLGVCAFDVAFDDLEAPKDRIVPALVLPFRTLAPDLIPERYRFKRFSNQQQVINTAVTQLNEVATPFFSGTKSHFEQYETVSSK